jgi:hypothetical protein
MGRNRGVAGALAWLGLPTTALAQEESGTKTAHELRADYDKDLKGKTIAFLPIATGVPLMDEWGRVIKTEAEWRGMKFVIRDPALIGDAAGAHRACRSKARRAYRSESERHAADEGA